MVGPVKVARTAASAAVDGSGIADAHSLDALVKHRSAAWLTLDPEFKVELALFKTLTDQQAGTTRLTQAMVNLMPTATRSASHTTTYPITKYLLWWCWW